MTIPGIREPSDLPGKNPVQAHSSSKSWGQMKARLFEPQRSPAPTPFPYQIANRALFPTSRFWNAGQTLCTTHKLGPVNSEVLYTSLRNAFKGLTQSGIPYFGAPTYSPDLNPNDFEVFPKILFTLKKISIHQYSRPYAIGFQSTLAMWHDWNMCQTFQADSFEGEQHTLECTSSDMWGKKT